MIGDFNRFNFNVNKLVLILVPSLSIRINITLSDRGVGALGVVIPPFKSKYLNKQNKPKKKKKLMWYNC